MRNWYLSKKFRTPVRDWYNFASLSANNWYIPSCPIRSRTGRIGVVNLTMSVGIPSGLLLSNVLFRTLGYWPVYAVSAGLYLLALLYIALRIDNNAGRTEEEQQLLREQRVRSLIASSLLSTGYPCHQMHHQVKTCAIATSLKNYSYLL